jgi:hypothetical protein
MEETGLDRFGAPAAMATAENGHGWASRQIL